MQLACFHARRLFVVEQITTGAQACALLGRKAQTSWACRAMRDAGLEARPGGLAAMVLVWRQAGPPQ